MFVYFVYYRQKTNNTFRYCYGPIVKYFFWFCHFYHVFFYYSGFLCLFFVTFSFLKKFPVYKVYINNMGQKCEGNCGLWVLNEIIKKAYPENLKKIMDAVWELPAK